MKIISYNIHSGKNVWFVPQLYRIIRFLNMENASVIGVQEINENNKRGRQVTSLSIQLDMDYHFGPNLPFGDGHYGIATLASLPILERKHLLLPSKKEQRGLLDTVVEYNQREVHILNTHLGLSKEDRLKQFQFLEDYLSQLTSPYILLGDLNTTEHLLNENNLFDAAKEMNREHQSTLMLSKKRIDYIFVSPDFKVINYRVIPVNMSDHYPIEVEVEFNN